MAEAEALLLSPIRLAYLGDAVYDLYVRTSLVLAGGKAQAMHREAISLVNAGAQARALSRVAAMLSETESDVVRRGRNAHAHHGVPKRADPADYAQATGLEALLGFLYLTGRTDRLQTIFTAMYAEAEAAHAGM